MTEVTPVTLLIGGTGSDWPTRSDLLQPLDDAGLSVIVAPPEPLVRWTTGCLCCAPRNDIARALRAVLPRARRDEIRHVVIQASGPGDPGPVLATLLSDPVAASAFQLAAIVAVVDWPQRAALCAKQETAMQHVAMADRIVMTESGTGLDARLRKINPGVPIIFATQDRLMPETILHTGLSGPAPDLQTWLPINALPAPDAMDQTDPGDTGLESFGDIIHEPLPWPPVKAWLERLVLLHGASVMRMKAILNVRDQPGPWVVHSVRHLLFPPLRMPAWPAASPRTSRLLLNTRRLRRSDWQALLADLRRIADVPHRP